MATPLRMSNRHHSILDYLLQNPATALGPVSKHFGVSQSWLSVLIHSDLFQAEWRRRRGALETVQDHAITQRLSAVATRGLEVMEEALSVEGEGAPSPRDVSEMTKTALQGLGYIGGKNAGPGTVVNIQQNVGAVTHDELREAREIFQRATRALPAPV